LGADLEITCSMAQSDDAGALRWMHGNHGGWHRRPPDGCLATEGLPCDRAQERADLRHVPRYKLRGTRSRATRGMRRQKDESIHDLLELSASKGCYSPCLSVNATTWRESGDTATGAQYTDGEPARKALPTPKSTSAEMSNSGSSSTMIQNAYAQSATSACLVGEQCVPKRPNVPGVGSGPEGEPSLADGSCTSCVSILSGKFVVKWEFMVILRVSSRIASILAWVTRTYALE
jgi:hypothetical protein